MTRNDLSPRDFVRRRRDIVTRALTLLDAWGYDEAEVPLLAPFDDLRTAVGTDAIAKVTLQVMGNLVDGNTPGAAGRVFRLADRSLGIAEPLLRKTRAKP